jgi:hypothetical protein
MIVFIKKNLPKHQALREVSMDDKVAFLKRHDKGFKTFGVSSCIVFVGFCNDELLFMHHQSTVASGAPTKEVAFAVENNIDYLAFHIEARDIPLNTVTVYALGGQESSQNTVNYLRKYASDPDNPLKLDLSFLHLVHDEDYFDLYIPRGDPTFYAIHHRVPLTEPILTDIMTPSKQLIMSRPKPKCTADLQICNPQKAHKKLKS